MSEVGSYEVSERDRKRLVVAFPQGETVGRIRLQTDAGVVDLPAVAEAAIRRLLQELASGAAVHVVAGDAELTTQDAADLLGLSRTYVVRLIDQGTLPAHMAGTHRRLRLADVLAYQARRTRRLDAVGEITSHDVAAGVPYR
jgi:excisionase family DNA binding protein